MNYIQLVYAKGCCWSITNTEQYCFDATTLPSILQNEIFQQISMKHNIQDSHRIFRLRLHLLEFQPFSLFNSNQSIHGFDFYSKFMCFFLLFFLFVEKKTESCWHLVHFVIFATVFRLCIPYGRWRKCWYTRLFQLVNFVKREQRKTKEKNHWIWIRMNEMNANFTVMVISVHIICIHKWCWWWYSSDFFSSKKRKRGEKNFLTEYRRNST